MPSPNQDTEIKAILIVCMVSWFIAIASFIGYNNSAIDVRDLREEAIELGYANYNPTNGIWQWKK